VNARQVKKSGGITELIGSNDRHERSRGVVKKKKFAF